jgi:hypothetical protein
MNRQEELKRLQKQYKAVRPGEEAKKRFAASLETAPAKKHLATWKKTALGLAAVMAVLVAAPNVSAPVANALGDLPVVGGVFQVITFRDYQYESDRFQADVKVPEIISAEYADAVSAINADIEATAQELIAQFETEVEQNEGYQQLQIDSSVVCDNERWFTLKVLLYQGAGSGYEHYKYYTIDKENGQWVQLGDILADANQALAALSEEIKTQMRTLMAADENVVYWVDEKDSPGLNFTGLKADQNFYFAENGDLVIVFDEYEVAPGSMGCPQFTLPAATLPALK